MKKKKTSKIKNDVFVALPAYNEGAVIEDVIKDLNKNGFKNIVVVDDGSKDNSGEKAQKAGARIFRHIINRGKGAATKTAVEACIRLGAEYIVTMDADGQHLAKDISRVSKELKKKNTDVVIGSRFLEKNDIPTIKVIYNKIANLVALFLFGVWVNDSQSGLRGLTREAAQKVTDVGDQYEYETEMLREINRNNLQLKEIPISVLYTDHSEGKTGNKTKRQNLFWGIKTFIKLIFNRIK